MNRTWFSTAILALVLSPITAYSIDSVTRRGVERPIGGEIKSISKTEVVVFQKVGSKEEKIPANEIISIDWDAEPPEFGLGRGHEDAGNYTQAMEQLIAAAAAAKGADPNVRADIEFYIARIAAKSALADPEQASAATETLKTFVAAHRDNFRIYEAQSLLAEVALRMNDVPAAESAFNALSQAPWSDTKMAGQLGLARVMLSQQNITGARAGFDEVVALEAKLPAEQSRHLQGMLGQARCLQLQMQHAEAIKILEQVIEQAGPEETRTIAEAYLRQGDSLAALGQNAKEAVLAYLHVDVIPALAEEGDLHAEALYQLSKLWNVVGQAARGAEASAKLEQMYPKSEWTKKLGGG